MASKSNEFWWKMKVIRRPKSESVLEWISGRYFIDFVSLRSSFWSPEGASFGVTASWLSIWRQFWSLKFSPIWGLKMTNGLRGFFWKFKLSKGLIAEVPHCVYIVFSEYKLAFVNMNDWIHLYRTWVLCAQKCHFPRPARGPTPRSARYLKANCM